MTGWSAERKAAARTRREAERLPLLAAGGLTKTWTASEVEEADARREARWGAIQQALAARLRAQAAQARAVVAGRLDAGDLARLDEYRSRTYPPTPEYTADWWRRIRGVLLAPVAP